MATDNSDLQSDPLADPIVEIGLGLFKASVVCQAVELGIFDQIENFNNGVTAGILANQYEYNLEVTGRLLNALVCYGLLKKNKNKDVTEYSNTKTTQKYLLKSVQPNLTNTLLSDRLLSHAMGKFNTILKKGTDTTGYDGLLKGSNDGIDFTNLHLEKKIIKTDQNENPVPGNNEKKTRMNARAFMTQMDSMMCPVVHAITMAFDVADHKTLLDLGGSSGYLAYEFVKTYPQMKAIVLDRPDTIEVAKELQPICTKSKVEFIEGKSFYSLHKTTIIIKTIYYASRIVKYPNPGFRLFHTVYDFMKNTAVQMLSEIQDMIVDLLRGYIRLHFCCA